MRRKDCLHFETLPMILLASGGDRRGTETVDVGPSSLYSDTTRILLVRKGYIIVLLEGLVIFGWKLIGLVRCFG